MTAPIISVDFETRSPVDIKRCGAYPYFEHPATLVLMAAYRMPGAPVSLWTYDQPDPEDLLAAIRDGATLRAWNASFEIGGFRLLEARRGWPMPRLEQFSDTAAAAAAMALPRALGDAAEALALPVQKDKEGTRLIRKFSMPRRPRKDEAPEGLYWNEPEDHPDDWRLFGEYCKRDVETEEAAAARLVPLSDYEQSIWLLNQRINDRGIRIDRTSAQAAIRLAAKAKAGLDREMREATGGAVPATTQPARLVTWVQDQGVAVPSAAKADIADLLECDDVPAHVRKALEIRQEAAKTSVSKLDAMLRRANSDGRVRGTSLYHAASTGRFQSQGVNTSNMPRPRREFDDEHPRRDVLFAALRNAEPALLPLLYGDVLGRPLHLVSDAIRGFIWAAPGHELLQADYSGIEGAVIAWLAGEDWKVAALHAIIADPSLPDMYRRTAASIMNTTTDVVTKKHPLRQSVGKVSELALGFGGGVPAFYSMSRNYNVKLDGLYAPVWEAADEERRERAVRRYESCLKRGDSKTDVLSREAWIACEIIKVGWRATNPAITKWWATLENAAREAVRSPGVRANAGPVDYLVANGFLWCRLPSGRCLAYGAPKLKDQVWAKRKLDDGTWGDAEVMDWDAAFALEMRGRAEIQGPTSPKVTVLGVNPSNKKFYRFGVYSGILAENVTQAVARDLLCSGMMKAEAAGYPIIATVYDEIICEVPRGFGDLGEFEKLICELPAWAEGLPLTAGGWRGKRYRKE